MVVEKKVGRSRKRKIIKKEIPKIKVGQTLETKKGEESLKDLELFPKREPIYGGNQDLSGDPTELVRYGKPWIPEENGYIARFMTPEQVKLQGLRGYIPVSIKSGIRIKDHPLTVQELTNTSDFGSGICLHPKDNAENDKELSELTGGRSNYVKLNSAFLCLIPKEIAEARRNDARRISNNTLAKQLEEADKEAQQELGNDKRRVGRFKVGSNAQRSEVDRIKRTTKKIWSVSAQIK